MSTTSAVEKLKKLEAEVNQLRSSAKKEAMAAVKSALAALNALGFDYELVDRGDLATKTGRRKTVGITRKRDPNKVCPVCGEKGHDGRFHRWDKLKKKKAAKS